MALLVHLSCSYKRHKSTRSETEMEKFQSSQPPENTASTSMQTGLFARTHSPSPPTNSSYPTLYSQAHGPLPQQPHYQLPWSTTHRYLFPAHSPPASTSSSFSVSQESPVGMNEDLASLHYGPSVPHYHTLLKENLKLSFFFFFYCCHHSNLRICWGTLNLRTLFPEWDKCIFI